LFPELAYATEAAGEAVAEGGAESIGASFGAVYPNPAVLWPTWVAFLVLFFLLYKFAFPAILGMLDSRAERVRESLEKAEETKIEAERLMEDYKAQLAEARGEAAKVIEQGRKVADTMKDEIVAKANEEAAGIIAKAREAMEAERKAASADLQAQVANLSVAVAGKLLGERLSADEHAKLIEQYMSEVGGLNDN
jgi:F-type H+-transporting ATPase subunit b